MTARVQLVGPLPPLRTGIASYTDELIRAVGSVWDLSVLPEPGSDHPAAYGVASIAPRRGPDVDLPLILQLGNSLSHPRASELALRTSVVVVLHDVVLSHSRLGHYLSRRWPRGFVKEMRDTYGTDGEQAARRILRDPSSDELMRFPLVEPFVRGARVIVVHNSSAADTIRSLSPDAEVVRVPHGISLPHLTERGYARRATGLAEEDFVVLSLTHVNRFKRVPQLLAAFREVADRVPSAVLVVAGNVEPDIDLEREIAMLDLNHRVQVRGYVSDEEARLLARGADVAVNLRYPSTGETSGSLLRLLGAGIPVIISESTLGEQLPDGIGLRVPVGGIEVPLLAELLVSLEADDDLRMRVGQHGRRYVEEHRSMRSEVDGYRHALRVAYGLDLPTAPTEHLHEPSPSGQAEGLGTAAGPARASPLGHAVGGALADLGLQRHAPLLQTVAKSIVELALDCDRG